MLDAKDYEKLAAFYLGREVDERGELAPAPLLYDAKDLTTHAVIVGMTGSGKTGLAVDLLEEAAIDGIPALVIDPKGDMGNLALAFPELAPEDFAPWVDEGEAARLGRSVADHARATAETWRKGLEAWGQGADRVRRLRECADVRLWTPGSTAGHPLTVLKSFDPPPRSTLADPEALADRVQATTAGLLGLVGIEADPVQSRESILLANLLQHAWRLGRATDLAELVGGIQRPPFQRLGVLDLDAFYPAKDRMQLAMRLNGLLASPSFAAWMQGDPLDVDALLRAPDGRPRISVVCLSHLSEDERMSFVTVLLGEFLTWVRAQPGTSSLRALLYMDEIFGFFPPTANPPAKRPMLTLLKQARAFGVGVVLSTQNPVDLDYKGLSNCGTWFLGRLQTERDKMRVLDGLEGALAGAGALDRAALEQTLSGLGKRRFLLHNVHETAPVVFETRWAMSYLRGPLTRAEIERVVRGEKRAPLAGGEASAPAELAAPPERSRGGDDPAEAAGAIPATAAAERTLLPEGVAERFLRPAPAAGTGGATESGAEAALLYRPHLATTVQLHYVNARASLDEWRTLVARVAMAEREPAVRWEEGLLADAEPDRAGLAESVEPGPGASFAALPPRAAQKAAWLAWRRELKEHVYRARPWVVLYDAEQRLFAAAGEAEHAFRARARQARLEQRDAHMDKLRASFGKKLDAALERVRRAEEALGLQADQLGERNKGFWVGLGTSLLGALLSRKKASAGNVSRAGSAARSRARVAKEKSDVERAERDLAARKADLAKLEDEFRASLDALPRVPSPAEIALEPIVVHPRKADIDVRPLALLWIAGGAPAPADR